MKDPVSFHLTLARTIPITNDFTLKVNHFKKNDEHSVDEKEDAESTKESGGCRMLVTFSLPSSDLLTIEIIVTAEGGSHSVSCIAGDTESLQTLLIQARRLAPGVSS